MCGIAGLAGRPSDSAPVLRAMLDGLAHRGPDDVGTWADDVYGMTVGQRRLSIIDTSAAGHQPMTSSRGRYLMVYNGEIYNHTQMRRTLEAEQPGIAWRGHSDTETLLAGFEAWGIKQTLERSNGMFALAVWDHDQKKLTLARDRMGEKPLYLGWAGRRFCFASELGVLLRIPAWQPAANIEAVRGYMSGGYVRGMESAIAGIYRLPAAHLIEFSPADWSAPRDAAWLSRRLDCYWSIERACRATWISDVHSIPQSLESLLLDAVQLRMGADVPIGAFLSGGVDSSLVVALMQASSGQRVRTFSIGFHDDALDEIPHAEAVARHLGTEHTSLYATEHDALSLIPRLAETYSEPFADASQIPTMLVSALARRHVTVALSGDGGDELFGGYGRYFAILRLWKYMRMMPARVRKLMASALANGPRALSSLSSGIASRGLLFRLERLGQRLATSTPDRLGEAFISGYGVRDVLTLDASSRVFRRQAPPHVADTLRRLMYADQVDYLCDDILHKVDRASMAFSLEARIPLIDHRIVEFSWTLPTDCLAAGGHGKLPLREVLARYVPTSIFDRPKQGFAPPTARWLRGPLREWAESLLTPDSLSDIPILDVNGVRRVWRMHCSGEVDAASTLWSILMLASWRQRFGVHF